MINFYILFLFILPFYSFRSIILPPGDNLYSFYHLQTFLFPSKKYLKQIDIAFYINLIIP